MTLPRVIKLVLLVGILGALSWYFFKGYNHKITFKTKLSPSVVQNYLVKWENFKLPEDSIANIHINRKFKNVTQNYYRKDSLLKIDWNFKKINDTITLVTAKITNEYNPYISNIDVVNPKSSFYKTNIAIIERFAKSLKDFGKTFKTGNILQDTIPSKYCTYVTVSSLATNKAKSMLDNIGIIMSYIKGNDIKLDGNPFLEVINWDIEKDSISYNFCFPIKKQDSLPISKVLKFKYTEKQIALKVIFNGNYRDSERSWLTLLDYADYNKIKVEKKPTEFFLNDPHSGTNSIQWKAEVYLPLEE